MEKKKLTVPDDCKVTGLIGFVKVPGDWIDVKIDPPVEVRPKDHLYYTLNYETGVAVVYLRRYRSRWWKRIGSNAKEQKSEPKAKGD